MGKWKDLERIRIRTSDYWIRIREAQKNGYLWSFLDERGAQSAPVCHSGQASHREQRTAPGDKDINYR
jgi:hypothetical protein